uniref:Uncharacterized protein n=1 Tax=Chenopodium quinoa TaxID=63459 RepID=A0A803MWE5_CHEQI
MSDCETMATPMATNEKFSKYDGKEKVDESLFVACSKEDSREYQREEEPWNNIGSKSISWSSKKQATGVLSSSEADYISDTSAACEAVRLRRILQDLRQDTEDPTTIHCDNMSAITMTKESSFP